MASRIKKEKPADKTTLGLDFNFEDVLPPSGKSSDLPEQESLNLAPPVAASPLFASTLFALSTIDGLGQKGILALDIDFGLSTVWQTDHDKLLATLTKARVAAAARIAKMIADHPDELAELGLQEAGRMASEHQVHIVAGSDLPTQLGSLPDAPRWLFVQGNTNALYPRVAIALVGKRDPSPNGIKATSIISDMLAPYPITVISGLAEGIDEEAHYATLQKQKVNVAFLGHGINHEFPARTVNLRHQVIDQGGAVVSEYLPNDKYQKSFFVQRNRLQAGLSHVVVPVEAAVDGGTAHTVRFARKYNRPLFGIRWPGANGILSELEADGAPIFEVFTPQGKQALDAQLKKLVESKGGDSYPLRFLERRVLNEFRVRNATPRDIAQFIDAIRKNKGD